MKKYTQKYIKMHSVQTVSLEQAKKDLHKIVGLPISRAWKGYGQAIFLELGELHLQHLREPQGYRSVEIGDWTLGSLWYWKIIRQNKVEFDSAEFDKVGMNTQPVKQAIEQLEGAKIVSLALNDDITILSVSLSTGIVLQIDKVDTAFFNLSYNHKPYLSFDDEGIHYEHNEL